MNYQRTESQPTISEWDYDNQFPTVPGEVDLNDYGRAVIFPDVGTEDWHVRIPPDRPHQSTEIVWWL
jgi:hypothetical protein